MHRLALKLSDGPKLSEPVERRFSVLLASEQERLHHHLRQAVSQLAAGDVDIDFVVLLDDLRHWGHPDRYVQRQWARQFWTPTDPHADTKESE
jgi:CRISPR system Cascade subunit CasB